MLHVLLRQGLLVAPECQHAPRQQLQLSNVAGPIMQAKALDCSRVHVGRIPTGVQAQEVVEKGGHLLDTMPQRRQDDGEAVHPAVKIAPESALFDVLTQRPLRCRHDPNVDAPAPRLADGHDLPLLEHSQQLGLDGAAQRKGRQTTIPVAVDDYTKRLLAALRGEREEVTASLLTQTAVRPHPSLVEPLSARETEVLRFLRTPLSLRDVASELYVSVNTVRSHVKHIYAKLDVHSRAEAIARAEDLGLL